jgi:hypothetical protein
VTATTGARAEENTDPAAADRRVNDWPTAARKLITDLAAIDPRLEQWPADSDGGIDVRVIVPWSESAHAREHIAASRLCVNAAHRYTLRVTAAPHLTVSLRSSLTAAELAEHIAAGVASVDNDLRTGALDVLDRSLPSVARVLSSGRPRAVECVLTRIETRQYSAPYGSRAAAHPALTSLLLDASGIASSALVSPDDIAGHTRRIMEALRAAPELVDTARRRGGTHTAGRITLPSTAAHAPAAHPARPTTSGRSRA